MNKHTNMKSLLILFITFACGLRMQAQVEQKFELLQIVKIAEVYRVAPNLSFTAVYTYADSTLPDTILEHVNGTYKFSSGRFDNVLDSTEQIQGSLFNLTVSREDSSIIVNNRQDYAKQMELPFLDSMFRNGNVNSMSIVDYDDSTRKLTILFKPNSNYSRYEMKYDKNKFYISNIKYYIRNVMNDGTGVTSGTAIVNLLFSNYSTAPINPSVFAEDRFIYRSGSTLQVQPAFAGFNVVNNTAH